MRSQLGLGTLCSVKQSFHNGLFEGYSSTIHENVSDFPEDSPTNQAITISCILVLLNGAYFWVRQSSYSKTIMRKPA